MEKLNYDFILISEDGEIKVGDEIFAPNGRKGKILSIKSIKFLGWKVKIEGIAQLENITK
ncbi:hypothetical protein [Bacillus fungorum]|uniref:hypothetical protein n=1 Tax=Bacillus fungorum TaxID=2039284 RepID=UPI003F555FE9